MDVHGALLDERIVAPYLIEELGPAEDAADVGHEEMKQAEFGGPQFDLAVTGRNAARRRVKLESRDLDHVVRQLRRAPAHDRLDARKQLAPGIRLG